MAKEYWVCIIGPIDRSRVQHGGDGPLRGAVKNAWEKVFGNYPHRCSSGWGATEEEVEAIRQVQHSFYQKRITVIGKTEQ